MEDTRFRRLPEETIVDILLRLPARSVVRSGAACKAWRRITTDPHFLPARARRHPPPASILVHTYLDAAAWPCGDDDLPAGGSVFEDVAVDALPVSSADDEGEADRQRLLRYPSPMTHPEMPPSFRLLASCDGVLLFKKDRGLYLLCNPITRQWAELPRLPDAYCRDRDPEYAFYFHQPSGEFRLLCCSLTRGLWYIVSTGAAEPRHLTTKAEPDLITRFINSLLTTATTPVALHGSLHWPPLWGRAGTGETNITAFDTESETFNQLLVGPTSRTHRMLKLFEMDGLLAAADFGKEDHVDLWFLEDYSSGTWALRHQISSPWKSGSRGRLRNHWGLQSVAVAGDDEGNIILGNNDGLVMHNLRRETVRTVDSVMHRKNREFVSRHVFKGSLVQHTCFAAPPSADFPVIHSWS